MGAYFYGYVVYRELVVFFFLGSVLFERWQIIGRESMNIGECNCIGIILGLLVGFWSLGLALGDLILVFDIGW